MSVLYLLAALAQTESGASDVDPTIGSVPFVIDWSRVDRSVVDLSGYLEAPAGRDGFIRAQGEHLVDGRGRRFRIWGVNLVAGLTFPTAEVASRQADELARMGVNAVRLHHLDPDWFRGGLFGDGDSTRQLDAENLDRLDRLVAELKARGIYVNFNLNVFRRYRPQDDVPDATSLGIAKGATYFNRHLIELQKEFAGQLLSHVNPYTGTSYANEPAVITVELLNENSLVEAWLTGRLDGPPEEWGNTWSPLPRRYQQELTDQWNEWIAADIPPEELKRWQRLEQREAAQPVPRTPKSAIASRDVAIVRAEARFLQSVEQAYFAEMKRYLTDELGVQSMLIGDADHNDSIFGYPHIAANSTFDLLDGHGYWKHPSLGETVSADVWPMVNDPRDSTLVQFARTPVVGKPFTISETNHPYPHTHAAEGMPILTAYALLHDWDGFYWFSYRDGVTGTPGETGLTQNGLFGIDQDPNRRALWAACGVLWHEQPLRPAETLVVRRMPTSQLVDAFGPDVWQGRPFFDESFPLLQPLVARTRLEFSDAESDAYPEIAVDNGTVTSETGEIRWSRFDEFEGVVTAAAQQCSLIAGFQPAETAGRLQTALTAPLVSTGRGELQPFAAVMVVSLPSPDGNDAADGARRRQDALLVTAGQTWNTGFRWQPRKIRRDVRRTVAEWGSGPTRLLPVRGTVGLDAAAFGGAVRVTPLDAAGVPLSDAARTITAARDLQGDGKQLRIALGDFPPTCWYHLAPATE